jgi:hypothetical protein
MKQATRSDGDETDWFTFQRPLINGISKNSSCKSIRQRHFFPSKMFRRFGDASGKEGEARKNNLEYMENNEARQKQRLI